jgi:hypothetical protein
MLAAGLASGCGRDDEPAAQPITLPELTVPQTDEAPPPEPETDTTAPADSPENDTPPPADSPAERFEDFCNENPGACG